MWPEHKLKANLLWNERKLTVDTAVKRNVCEHKE